jgi:hypothetical protein
MDAILRYSKPKNATIMKKCLFGFLFMFSSILAFSQPNSDKSLSPYFLIKGEASTTEAFPLKSTSAEVNIAGVIADVIVRQEYHNTGTSPIEAIYVFPASTRAAVYGMEMKVGNRIIKAKIAEKQAARQEYEQARSEGKRASLLEQERPNVFQMNVANIMPGDQVEVVLYYTELLLPEQGEYQFVYPTVVGPRYTEGTEQSNNGYTNMPYTSSGDAPQYTFDIQVYINGGMPIQEVTSTSHSIRVHKGANEAINVLLDTAEKTGGNRDFILNYSFEGDQIETGMLVYNDGEEQFFLCMAQPPKRVETAYIPSREYIFVMDISGSMRGFPLEVSKDLMNNLVSQLRPNDRFNILFFAGGSQLWKPSSQSANAENLEEALHFMQNMHGGGGTRLLPALDRAMNLPRQSTDLSRSIIVITDGYVSVENETFELIRNNLNQSNVFAFGIGSSVNRHIIEGIAHAGQGVPFIVTQKAEAYAVANRFQEYIKSPVMTQISVNFDNFDAYDFAPSVIPDVLSERPVIIFGKYRGSTTGNLSIEGIAMQNPKKKKYWFSRIVSDEEQQPIPTQVKLAFPLEQAKSDERNKALKYLWARERIRQLADFNGYGMSEEVKTEVTELGLKYNLLTQFTSFIAVEEKIVNPGEEDLKQVKQPLPLPEGVENSALGFQLHISGMSNLQILDQPSYSKVLFWIILTLIALIIFVWIAKRDKKDMKTLIMIGFTIIGLSSCKMISQPESNNPHQEVTFILGKDKSPRNPYYQNALAYFSTDSLESTPLIVSTCSTMIEVRHWLYDNAPIEGAWQQINLVAHGNEWTGINVPVLPNGVRCSAQGLEQAIHDRDFPALPNSVVNGQTRINILGCNVGKDSLLLDVMALAFGGTDTQRPIISSARHFNVFEHHGNAVSRHLAATYFVAFPAGSFPGNKLLAQQFTEKYPCEDINWKKALITLKPQVDKRPYVHYFNIPAEWAVLYESTDKMPVLQTETDSTNWLRAQADLQHTLDQMQLPMEKFRWTIEEDQYQGHPVRIALGQSIIYCILKPVVDENQEYIRPCMADADYYTIR